MVQLSRKYVCQREASSRLPMSAGVSQTGAVRGGGTEFAIMTRSFFSSWAQLRKLSSAVIYVDIRKAFCSVLVEEVVGPVMGRSQGHGASWMDRE